MVTAQTLKLRGSLHKSRLCRRTMTAIEHEERRIPVLVVPL
jgi:hypothetical protein